MWAWLKKHQETLNASCKTVLTTTLNVGNCVDVTTERTLRSSVHSALQHFAGYPGSRAGLLCDIYEPSLSAQPPFPDPSPQAFRHASICGSRHYDRSSCGDGSDQPSSREEGRA